MLNVLKLYVSLFQKNNIREKEKMLLQSNCINNDVTNGLK